MPRAVAHVGISVPDLDAAVAWYREVLGFRPMAPPGEVNVSEGGRFVDICRDFFGPDFGRLRVAHLATANGVALELFEFISPPYVPPADSFDYRRGGISHLCVVDPDIDGLIARIVATGGRRRSEVWTIFEGQPYKAAYCEDPFG